MFKNVIAIKLLCIFQKSGTYVVMMVIIYQQRFKEIIAQKAILHGMLLDYRKKNDKK